MHTVVFSNALMNKAKGKFSTELIDKIVDQISENPKIGKKINLVNNLYLIELGNTINNKNEYSLVYYYENKNFPIYLINIFKKKEKDLLTKIISDLANNTILN